MEGASVSTNPRSVDEVFKDYRGRRAGMLKALTSGKAHARAHARARSGVLVVCMKACAAARPRRDEVGAAELRSPESGVVAGNELRVEFSAGREGCVFGDGGN